MIQTFQDKDTKKWCIRNGMFRTNCVVCNLSEHNLQTIHRQIGKILKIPDYKKEMENEAPAIYIKNKEQKEIFRFETDGKVFWLKNGKMVQAKIDKELAQAFEYCVIQMSGFSASKLIKKIRE